MSTSTPHRTPPNPTNPQRDYLRSLKRTRRFAIFSVLLSTAGIAFATFDIILFRHTGQSTLHPALSMLAGPACVALLAIALVSLRTTARYRHRVLSNQTLQ